MTAPATIWDLTDITGGPRFYPPGQHPAIQLYRKQLLRLRYFGGDDSDIAEYIRGQVAAFEGGESEAKARADWALRRAREERR